MIVEQWIGDALGANKKNYPKWKSYVDKDGLFVIILVHPETGKHIVGLMAQNKHGYIVKDSGVDRILQAHGYDCSFADWAIDGQFIRFRQGCFVTEK